MWADDEHVVWTTLSHMNRNVNARDTNVFDLPNSQILTLNETSFTTFLLFFLTKYSLVCTDLLVWATP